MHYETLYALWNDEKRKITWLFADFSFQRLWFHEHFYYIRLIVIKFNKLKMSKSLGILVYVSAVAILLLFAVLSNSLVIFCVAKFKKLRTVTNVLICNLAISDIILAGFVLPQKLHDMFHEEDFYEGEFSCF